MKITAYMNLLPKHTTFDTTAGIVSLTDSAREWHVEVIRTERRNKVNFVPRNAFSPCRGFTMSTFITRKHGGTP